jgi:hypothetical protein
MTLKPNRQRLYLRHVSKRNNCCTRTITNRVKAGKFPAPLRDELGHKFWWDDVLAEHEAKLEAQSAGSPE